MIVVLQAGAQLSPNLPCKCTIWGHITNNCCWIQFHKNIFTHWLMIPQIITTSTQTHNSLSTPFSLFLFHKFPTFLGATLALYVSYSAELIFDELFVCLICINNFIVYVNFLNNTILLLHFIAIFKDKTYFSNPLSFKNADYDVSNGQLLK